MADQSLDILIRILTEQVGADKAADILKQIKTGTEDAAQATKKHAEATAEATESTKKHTEHTGELNKMFHAMNRIVPGLGASLHSMFSSGPLAAAAAAGVGLLEIFGQINEITKEIKKQSAESFAVLSESVDKAREKVVELKKENEDFWTKLAAHRAEGAQQGVSDNSAAVLKGMIEFMKQRGGIVPNADIRGMVATGAITAAEGQAIFKAGGKIRPDQADAYGKYKEGEMRNARINELDKELAAAKHDLKSVNQEAASPDSIKRRAELNQLIAERELLTTQAKTGKVNLPNDIELDLSTTLGRQGYLERLNYYNAVVREKEKPFQDLDQRINSNQNEITRAQAERDKLSRDAASTSTGFVSSLGGQVGANIRDLQTGKKLSQDQLDQNATMTRLLSTLGYNSKTSLDIMKKLAGNSESERQTLDALSRRIATLESQTANKRNQ